MRKLIAVAVLVLVVAGFAMAADDSPMMFTTATTSAHWIGAPAIAVNDIGLVHPASGLVRLGNATATIVAYSYGQYVIGQTADGGLLDVSFADGTWRYYASDGSAEGTVTAWW